MLGRLDRAVESLESLAREERGSAAIQNDLAVAYLVRAERMGRPQDLPRALEAATIAVEADPSVPEALYNHALALDALSLHTAARTAWVRYLAVAPTEAGWDTTARGHLQALSSKRVVDRTSHWERLGLAVGGRRAAETDALIRESVEASRLYFEHRLGRLSPGPEDASAIVFLGRRFDEVTGDSTIGDVAVDVARGDPGSIAALREYAAARSLYASDALAAAEPIFRRNATALRLAASPLAGWCELHLGIIDFQRGEVAAAGARLTALHRRLSVRSEPLLLGRVEWMLGILTYSGGRFDEAQRYYEDAAARFERAGDLAHASFMQSSVGEVLARLGRRDLGWVHRVRAFRQIGSFPDARRRANVLVVGGDWALAGGWPHAAEQIHAEALSLAADAAPADRATCHLSLARSTAVSHPDRVAGHLAEARHLIHTLSDAPIHERMSGELIRTTAETGRSDGTETPDIDAAIDWLRSRRATGRLAPLLYRRGVLRAAASAPGAEQDLRDVIRLAQQASASAEDLRISHARLALSSYDALLGLAARSGADALETLTLAEGRWEAADGRRDEPLDRHALGELLELIPSDVAILGYVSTDTDIWRWTMRTGDVQVSRSAVTGAALASFVSRSIYGRQRGVPDTPADAQIHQALFGPRKEALAGHRRVYVIPSGPIARAPLALVSSGDGPAVGERLEIALMPSLAFAAETAARSRSKLISPRTFALAFASGSGDLPPLPSVEAEAQEAVRALGDGNAVVGRQADRDAFNTGVVGAQVVHFAGHAVSNDDRPSLSSLIVAGPGGRDEHLTAAEIRKLPLASARLVFLAACSAGRSEADHGEGLLTLARPFLAAGATVVVAPLWDVTDGGMRAVTATFYESYARERDVRRALRDTLTRTETTDAQSLALFTAEGALTKTN